MKIIFECILYVFVIINLVSPLAFAKTDKEVSSQKISSEKISTSSDAAARSLVALFKQLNSLQTSFEQITLDAGGRNLQMFTGKLLLQKPLNFYYETDPPHNQIIALKQNEVWLYDKDLEQVVVQPFDQQFSQTPIMLIVKPVVASLQKHFRVKAGKLSELGQQQFELIPLAKDQLYNKIRFHFSQNHLYEIQLEDNLGQKTVITFYDDAIYNRPIATKQFQLQLPENVDILR